MPKRQRSGSSVAVEEDRSISNIMKDGTSESSSIDDVERSASVQSLGVFLWSEVNTVLYTCILKYLHYTCGILAIEQSKERRQEIIHTLRKRLVAFWESEKSSLNTTEQTSFGSIFHSHVNAMIERLSSLAAADMAGSGLCLAFLQTLDVFGFPEEENTEEALLVASMRKNADVHAYSYHQRTSLTLSVLPRYEGDRRTDNLHRPQRVGRIVHLPSPHSHPEVNTEIQLIEPKKRRPSLDENRIFSHPKKATSSGMEDILVDEEMRYRSLVVLGRHLDTFGSPQHLSPFLRFFLWDVLGRDNEVFDRLNAIPATSAELLEWQKQHLEPLRRLVAEKRAVFDATRAMAREAAVRAGWYAVSAHWRDQVLRVVEEGEDADWFLLRDAAKAGVKAIFPNYAGSTVVKDIALKALRRVRDGHVDCGVENAVECYEVITDVLFPLLEGKSPAMTWAQGEHDKNNISGGENGENEYKEEEEEVSKRVTALVEEEIGKSARSDTDIACGVRWSFDAGSMLPRKGLTCTFVTDMFVWPLQCLASLLELIAVGRYSVDGIKKFAAALLPSNWGDQESVLEFLLRREPTNIPLASFVGFPRVVRDAFVSAQWLRNDKCFTAVVECRRQACRLTPGSKTNNYVQWRTLATVLNDINYSEDMFALTVHEPSPDGVEEGKLWSVAELECTPKNLVEGLSLMLNTTTTLEEA